MFNQPAIPWQLTTSTKNEVCGVLLPDYGAATGAALPYFGLESYPNTRERTFGLGRFLRRWHQRHGAELVGSWGTTLSLDVQRPPSTIEDAQLLALEHGPLDDHGSGLNIWEQAYALVNQFHWTLHIKP